MPARPRTPRRSGPAADYLAAPWLAAYPSSVPAAPAVPEVPLTTLLDESATAYPSAAALACLGEVTTYRELRSRVDRCAAALAGLGVGPGDRVAVLLPNCPQAVVSLLATLRIGAVAVPLNPLLPAPELQALLADAGAGVAICLDRVLGTVEEVRARTALHQVVVTSLADALPGAKRAALRLPTPAARRERRRLVAELPAGTTARRWADWLEAAPVRPAPVDVVPDDLAVLQYTTGTTGPAKAAMLSHRNLVANAHQCRWWVPDLRTGREVTLGVLPLFHAYGLTLCLTSTVLIGGLLVLVPAFDQAAVLDAVDRYRPTLFPGVPPMYRALLDNPASRDHDLSSVKVCISGAMPLPRDLQDRFEARLGGGVLVEGFGMTEASPVTHCTPITGDRRTGTIGVPLPMTEAMVVDPDRPLRTVPTGVVGELVVRGPQVFGGYWNRPDEPDPFTEDGWLLTGDLATMDADGFFSVVDRKKDIVLAGGFNIAPAEVEAVIAEVEGVAEVCVVGLPDEYRGETLKAYVVAETRADADGLDGRVLDRCRQELVAYKVPTAVELRDSLPRGGVGKVLRRVLRDEELARRAAEPAVGSVPGSAPQARDAGAAQGAPEPS